MNRRDMINYIEKYLLEEYNDTNTERIIDKKWIHILYECLMLLKNSNY